MKGKSGLVSVVLHLIIICLSIFEFVQAVEKPPVSYVYSPNYSERNCTSPSCYPPYEIDGIAIHTTEETLERTFEIFQSTSSSASAHYVIASNGSIYQMVDDHLRAYTTTYVNCRTIGIELVAWSGDKESLTYPLLGSLVQLVSWLVEEYDIQLRHPNTTAFDFPVKTAYGYYNETGIYGHFQVQTCGSVATEPKEEGGGGYSCKTDPGPFFPWDEFMNEVAKSLGKIVEPVPLKDLRYDCTHLTSMGETIFGIAAAWKINYWQDICLYNYVLKDYCAPECLIGAQCGDLPEGVLLGIPAVVIDYFPECPATPKQISAELGATQAGYEYSETLDVTSEDSTYDDEETDYQSLFYVMLGINIALIISVFILIILIAILIVIIAAVGIYIKRSYMLH